MSIVWSVLNFLQWFKPKGDLGQISFINACVYISIAFFIGIALRIMAK